MQKPPRKRLFTRAFAYQGDDAPFISTGGHGGAETLPHAFEEYPNSELTDISIGAWDPYTEHEIFFYADREDTPTLKAHLRLFMSRPVRKVRVVSESPIKKPDRRLSENYQRARRRRL